MAVLGRSCGQLEKVMETVFWLHMRLPVFINYTIMAWGSDFAEQLIRTLRAEPVVVLIGFAEITWYVSLLPNNDVFLCREVTAV